MPLKRRNAPPLNTKQKLNRDHTSDSPLEELQLNLPCHEQYHVSTEYIVRLSNLISIRNNAGIQSPKKEALILVLEILILLLRGTATVGPSQAMWRSCTINVQILSEKREN